MLVVPVVVIVVVLVVVTGVKQSQILDLSLGLEFDKNITIFHGFLAIKNFASLFLWEIVVLLVLVLVVTGVKQNQLLVLRLGLEFEIRLTDE